MAVKNGERIWELSVKMNGEAIRSLCYKTMIWKKNANICHISSATMM